MRVTEHFGDVLERFISQDGRRARQLEKVSALIFGELEKVPHNSISRWIRGEVRRPHQWQAVFKLAIVLRLTEQEVSKLLIAARYPTLDELRNTVTTKADRDLLSRWQLSNPAADWLPPFQAPQNLIHFTGRREEINQTSQILRHSQTVRICCLQGMAGVGKTSLAVYLAYQLRDHFADGILWVSLPHSNPMSALRNFAEAYRVNVDQYSDLSSRSSKVRSLLADKNVLIVLDDVVNDEQVWPLLPPTGAGAVIITTRRHDLAVGDSAFCLPLNPFDIDKRESLTLLTKVLGQDRVNQECTELTEMANLLGHLPLAIAITAGRLKGESGWPTVDFLQRIRQDEQRLSVLSKGNKQVRLSIELSYNTLAPTYQLVFAALGLFPGENFGNEAVAHTVDMLPAETEDALRHLHDFSLLALARSDRYRLHPLLRDYSREQSCPPAFIERLITYFIQYIHTHANNYLALDLEMSNILGILTTAYEQDFKTELIAGIIALYPFLQARGLYKEAYLHLRRAEAATKHIHDQQGRNIILKHLGSLAVLQGHYAQAHDFYQEALALARETGNTGEEKILLTKLGVWAYWQGAYEQAKQFYDTAMYLAEQTNDMYRVAVLLTNQGLIADDEGEMNQAESHYKKALKIARRLKDSGQLHLTILQNLGDIMDKCGNYDAATQYLQEGLALAQETNDPELESRFLLNLGLVAYSLGNYLEAIGQFRRGITLAQRSNLTLQLSRHYASLGRVKTVQRDFEIALVHYQEALTLARQLGALMDICKVLNLRGECYLHQRKLNDANSSFEEAHQIALETNLQLERAKSLYGLARVAEQWGNLELAYQRGQESATILTQAGHKRAREVQWWLKELPSI